jgi:hypothetical protein
MNCPHCNNEVGFPLTGSIEDMLGVLDSRYQKYLATTQQDDTRAVYARFLVRSMHITYELAPTKRQAVAPYVRDLLQHKEYRGMRI